MACIILVDHEGVERVIPENTPFTRKPTEKIKGVDYNCHPEKSQLHAGASVAMQLAQELDKATGQGLGDLIKVFATPVARMIGRKSCSKCEARRVTINAFAKLKAKLGGTMEAVKKMNELRTLIKEDPEKAMEELKELIS